MYKYMQKDGVRKKERHADLIDSGNNIIFTMLCLFMRLIKGKGYASDNNDGKAQSILNGRI